MFHCFLTEMENDDRMPSRVLQVLSNARASVESLSFSRQGRRLVLSFVVDADEKQLHRIESLLWKIYGMLFIQVQSDVDNKSPSGGRA